MRVIDKNNLNNQLSTSDKTVPKESASLHEPPVLSYKLIAILSFALFCTIWWGAIELSEEAKPQIITVEQKLYRPGTYFKTGGR